MLCGGACREKNRALRAQGLSACGSVVVLLPVVAAARAHVRAGLAGWWPCTAGAPLQGARPVDFFQPFLRFDDVLDYFLTDKGHQHWANSNNSGRRQR